MDQSTSDNILAVILKNQSDPVLDALTTEVWNRIQAKHLIGVQPIQSTWDTIMMLRYVLDETSASRCKLNMIKRTVGSVNVEYDTRVPADGFTRVSFSEAHAQALADEIDQYIIVSLRERAIKGMRYIRTSEPDSLAAVIENAAMRISQNTMRNRGNFAVLAPIDYATMRKHRNVRDGVYMYGHGNQEIRLIEDRFATEGSRILVGYRGETQTDAGVFWTPFKLLERVNQEQGTIGLGHLWGVSEDISMSLMPDTDDYYQSIVVVQ